MKSLIQAIEVLEKKKDEYLKEENDLFREIMCIFAEIHSELADKISISYAKSTHIKIIMKSPGYDRDWIDRICNNFKFTNYEIYITTTNDIEITFDW